MNTDTEKKINLQISTEDVEKQYRYMQEIKEMNLQYTMETRKQKLFTLQSFGCQMNENDSERLAGMLAEMGYAEAQKTDDSDLIIFNTCCVRENAELKVYGHLGALKQLKKEKPGLVIAVCGCMMQQKEVVEHIKKKYRHVDIIFGTHNLHKFPELIHNLVVSGKTVIDIWESSGIIAEDMPIERKEGVKAWVTVMYGCNNFCSYCIVPYVRGRERSRHTDDIVNEITTLGQHNYKEITLLGQNVNSYGKDLDDGSSFAKLLYRVNEIKGIERIRFMTSHPKDLSDELVEAIKNCSKVCEHLHLPIQSGSTRILKEMNRNYSKEHYLERIEKIKSEIPGIALTTDIIVGFPGETGEDFDETLDLMERVGFDSAYTFLYSKRTGTPAAKRTEQVSREEMKQRFNRLVEVQNRISREINDALLGSEPEVLVEGQSKNSLETFTGRTRTNKIVNFKGNNSLIGKLVTVRIEKIQTWSLEGSIIGQ